MAEARGVAGSIPAGSTTWVSSVADCESVTRETMAKSTQHNLKKAKTGSGHPGESDGRCRVDGKSVRSQSSFAVVEIVEVRIDSGVLKGLAEFAGVHELKVGLVVSGVPK